MRVERRGLGSERAQEGGKGRGEWREPRTSVECPETREGAACGSEGSRGPPGCDRGGAVRSEKARAAALLAVSQPSGRGRGDVRCSDERGRTVPHRVGKDRHGLSVGEGHDPG